MSGVLSSSNINHNMTVINKSAIPPKRVKAMNYLSESMDDTSASMYTADRIA